MQKSTEINKNRRNRSVLAALIVYAITNALGLVFLRSPAWYTFHYGPYFMMAWSLLGLVIAGFFVAFCIYGARARGYSGWVGLPIALLGLIVWGGVAFYLVFPKGVNGYAPRTDNDGPRVLIPLMFAVAALVLRALPKRVSVAAATEIAA